MNEVNYMLACFYTTKQLQLVVIHCTALSRLASEIMGLFPITFSRCHVRPRGHCQLAAGQEVQHQHPRRPPQAVLRPPRQRQEERTGRTGEGSLQSEILTRSRLSIISYLDRENPAEPQLTRDEVQGGHHGHHPPLLRHRGHQQQRLQGAAGQRC